MEQLLTLVEVAQRLGVSTYTLKTRLREAGIRGPRPGRLMLLSEQDCQQLLEHMRQRQRGASSTPDAVKAEMRKLRARQTRRLGKKHHGPVVSLNLERK